MVTQSPNSTFQPTEATWHRVEELLAEVAALSRETTDAESFFTSVLDRLLPVLQSVAGIVWTVKNSAALQVAASAHLELDDPRHREGLAFHRRLAEITFQARTAQTVLPGASLPADAAAINHSRHVLLLQPILSIEGCCGVIEVVCPSEWPDTARRFSSEVLASIAELCADFERHRRLHELADRESESQHFDSLLRNLYGALDLQEAAYLLANEGRQFIGCDRVTVLVRNGNRMRTMSVSGIAAADSRADVLRRLETLTILVADGGSPLIVSGASGQLSEQLPEQLSIPLHDYLNISPARSLTVLPLRPPGSTSPKDAVAAMVIEQFSSEPDPAMKRRTESLTPHASQMLRNALFVAHIPFARTLLRRWTATHKLVKARRGLIAGILAAGLVAVFLVPADFTVPARGELQPQRWRDVFAPNDGTVDELLVDENAAVEAGQPLLTLRNPELQLELKRVLGEIETSRERLAAIRTARIEGTAGSSVPPASMSRLSGEEAEVTALLGSLERQLRLLNAQQADLVVRSPLPGRVLTWDVEHLLRGRPVKRGQALLTIADTQGPWKIELRLPDKHAGHVLEARRVLGPELNVEYFLATDPATWHSSHIAGMGLATDTDEQDEPAVLVTADVVQGAIAQPRPHAAVTARVYCGRRSLVYVWLHDAIDSFRRLLFF